jgi:hypothetical protein
VELSHPTDFSAYPTNKMVFGEKCSFGAGDEKKDFGDFCWVRFGKILGLDGDEQGDEKEEERFRDCLSAYISSSLTSIVENDQAKTTPRLTILVDWLDFEVLLDCCSNFSGLVRTVV